MGKAESRVERLLHEGVKELGGKTYKFISPGCSGMPDRVVTLPNGDVHFVELKSETGVIGKQQKRRLLELTQMNQMALVLRGEAEVLHYLDNLRELMNE